MTVTRTGLSVLVVAQIVTLLWSTSASAAPRDLTVEKRHRPTPQVNVSLVPTTPSVVAIGTPFGFELMSTASGFGHLYVLSASGKVQLWFENQRLKANSAFSYPSPDLVVRAAPPAGDETVIFVATRERLAGFAGYKTTQSPLALQYTHAAFNSALNQKTSAIHRRNWASVSTVVRVQ